MDQCLARSLRLLGRTQCLGRGLEDQHHHGDPNWNEEDRAVLATVDELLDTNDFSDAIWAALAKARLR
jgi:hypothetical protein